MSKAGKRGKSGDVKGGPAGGGKWDQAISSGVFQEESWNPCVTWVVGQQAEDSKHIESLNIIVQTGTRKLFSVITKELLYADVRDLGNPKNKKVKETPANSEICEACKPYVDTEEPIPLPLLAKLIKWKLLAIKATDLKRREAEGKALKAKAVSEKKKGNKDAKDGGKERAKSPKKGGKKTPEPQTAKDGSKLRKRGEEDSDNKYIDDEPEDGCQHYILVTGFHDPRIFQFLEEIKVTVDSVIGIRSQDYTPLKRPPPPEAEPPAEPTEEDRKFKELQDELCLFWTDLLPLLQRLPDASSLHDIARLDYEVKALMVPSDPMDTEQKVQYSTSLFEDVAVMIYDLLDARRLYKTYLENLKLTRIPVYGLEESTAITPVPPPTPGAAVAPGVTSAVEPGGAAAAPESRIPPPPVDMRYYNDLMNTVPQESVSVPLILHCMLEQITANEEGREPPSEQAPPIRPDGVNFHLASYLTGVAFKLGLTESEHQMLSEVLELPSPPPDQPGPPELINVQDDISNRTQHLQPHYGFNPAAVEKVMLQFVPFAKLWHHQQRPTSAESRLRAARLQELIHYCVTEELSKSEIDRAFKQFVFESMDLATVDSNGFILDKGKEGLHQTAVPWDDPYPFFKVMLPQNKRPSLDIRCSSLSSEDSRSATAAQHRRASLQQERSRDAPAYTNGKMFGGTGRGACTPEIDTSRESRRGSLDESRKKSILVSARTSSPRDGTPKESRSNSVHWDADVLAEEPIQDIQDVDMPPNIRTKTVEEGVLEMVEAQQRNLDQWCFAEHFKPDILLQILREASYMLPFHEIYHHKRDETHMLVLYNPFGAELHNHVDWHKELHSNMGFRNYLDCVAESISEWLKEKEAEYQAHVLSKEVESINKEEEEKAKAAEKADAKGKKSPRKSASRSKSPGGSRSSSVERLNSQASNPYVRSGSLKAWQLEQDKIAQEEDEKERAKAGKRTRSATKQKEKDEKEKAEKEKVKSPRGSARSRKSNMDMEPSTAAPASQTDLTVEQQVEEPYWPFYGYDSGNQLIHVSGITTTLFPSDGGTIKTERTEFVQGTTAIRSVLQKDGHVFSIHVLNPREDMNLPEEYEALLESQAMAAAQTMPVTSESASDNEREGLGTGLTRENSADHRDEAYTGDKSEIEKSEKEDLEKPSTPREDGTDSARSRAHRPAVSQFGSITAQLSDGMILATSQFGSTGESYLKPYQPAQYIPPLAVTESASVPQTAAISPSKNKKDAPKKGQSPDMDKPADELDLVDEEKKDEEKKMPKQEFQELFVTCPDGLTVKYFLQSSIGVNPPTLDDRQLAVRQSYPYKTKGVQSCETARNKYIHSEVSRVITAEGNVVKNMVDGSVEVLSADGTVSRFTGVWQIPPSRSVSPVRSSRSDVGRDSPKKGGKNSAKTRRQTVQHEVEVEEEVKLEGPTPTWTITYPSGERLQINKDTGDCQELSSVPVCLATDPSTSQTMATRDDHVITVSYPDGTTVVEHADGTRITVYYRETAMSVEENDEVCSAIVSTQTLKFVKVECPAFATVEFNTSTSENLTVFGSGTSINVFPDGYYILHHSKGGRIEVDTEGTMVYFPRRSRFLEHLMPERELQYVLRHNADIILETVDPDGNVFNVRSTGDYNVIPVQADDALSDDSEEHTSKKIAHYGQHAPRFFIIHGDGSGTELLRYQDVAEYLMLAEQNPATAVLKDVLPDHPGVKGITVLKPYLLGLSEKWFKNYDQESIVPSGIRCRDLKTLPPKEFVKPGPKFGTNVGQGLNVGAANTGPVRVPILKCPRKLELRQVVQYKPMADSLRSVLRKGLRSYAEAVVGRMRAEALTNIDDIRTVDEQILAQDLKVLADTQRKETRDCETEHVKSIYEAAVAPPPPSPPRTPQPKRTLADWERDRREKEEEEHAKKKLKDKSIEPYFTSELGKAFLLTQASDMEDMMRQLSEDPRRDGNEAVRGDMNESRLTYTHSPMYNNNHPPVPPSQARASVLSDRSVTSESPGTQRNNKNGQETPLSYTAGMSEAATVTPSRGVRPHNPTPAHAAGQGSPAPVRPHNPTPAHAGKMQTDRPGNPTPKIALGVETPSEYEPSRGEYPMILEHPWEEEDTQLTSADRELARQRALTTNVVGELRTEPVPLPGSIKGGRPGAMPNVKYHTIEDPVRRKVFTSLTAGAAERGRLPQLAGMRGLICQPEGVNFGVLKEGCTYRYAVMLRNTGVDTCRFKIRQPPPATGLRVIYKPGPVAAGMCVELALELYAIANGVEGESGVGSLGHVLEIITETDLLELPIVATILTAHEYDNPAVSHAGMRNTNARLISTRPPASTGIIRPRRDNRTVVAS
ncbi:hypothetical protein EGW08_000422 [Elysia chlorotica]|uniref:Sperm-associated antigen 17 n=1 Tax=Elysia chlorotica TaxID=188477 RepID=A0A433UDD6_ELYCH|nr:hypothetical protein EGW08_000422 [Elysia chlorotica]